jgi:HAE1 family hydrophobic/amphiphilic exporter-1
MKPVRFAIDHPVTVIVGVLLVVIFGMLALFRIPVQLIPDVDVPQAVVTTVWPGASPEEIETEIVREQEEQLKAIEGLVEMKSESRQSSGVVRLKFQTGMDQDGILLRVSNRLQQVPQYPANALKPVVTSKDPFEENAMAWLVFRALPGSDIDMEHEREFVEETVKPALERVLGVATANIYGGVDRELQVIVDPQKLALRGLSIGRVAAVLDVENRDVSAGDFDEGKRAYVVRTVGEYGEPADVEAVVLAWIDGAPVYVRDVATVRLGYRDRDSVMRERGHPTISLGLIREAGSNTLLVMAGVEETMAELNAGPLAARGVELTVAFAESGYIERAISLVQRNIFVGGGLAILVLLLFLRSISSTFVVGLAIPVSIIGTFLVMTALGRNINVVSLAGLAFAVGMIVDASIVVLENIYRHVQMGKSRRQAAAEGTSEVWGAVLASGLTTIAVFLPVVFVQEEAGQLFRDIAVAVCAAVAMSLVVSVTLIPTLSARILSAARATDNRAEGEHGGWRDLGGIVHLGERFSGAVSDLIHAMTASMALRLTLILVLTVGALGTAWALMPDTEYLPTGNMNFAFGFVLPPPGYNIDENIELTKMIEERLRPYWEAMPGSPEAAELDAPPIEQFFAGSFSGGSFMGAITYPEHSENTRQLIDVMQGALMGIPGTFGIVQQPSIFQRGADPGRSINVDITGPELERLIELGGRVFGAVTATMPGAQAQPIPSLDLGNPEIRVIPDRERAAEMGLTASDIGFALNALVDGVKVSEYQYQGRSIDLVLRGADPYAARSQDIQALNIATPSGRSVTIGDVAEVIGINGPQQINHIERVRALTIQIIAPREMALEAAMRHVQEEILAPMRADGSFGGPYDARLAGTADKLTSTRRALQANFILALVVTYLLMAALFESFLYPFVIMFSVPFAAVGGFLGLWGVNALIAYQALDVIAMLGFVILIGIVVNNAILIVHQTLNYMRDGGLHHREALRTAVRDRIRPIFMSTLTSVMGMSPLVLFSGAGAEIYRGLGSVVVGGLVVSTLFTLILVPAVFSVVLDVRESLQRRWRERRAGATAEA